MTPETRVPIRRLGGVLLLLMLALSSASAGGPAPGPGQVTVFAPLDVEGAALARLDGDGMMVLRGAGGIERFELRAERMTVTLYTERAECIEVATVRRCAEVARSRDAETIELTGARLRAKGELGDAFDAAFSVREDHRSAYLDAPAGVLDLSQATGRASLDAAPRIAPRPAGAQPSAAEPALPPHGPVLGPRASDFVLDASDVSATAEGAFVASLSGVAVHLVGVDREGRLFDRVVVTGAARTPAPYGSSELITLLVADVAEATLDARLSTQAALWGKPVVRAQEGVRVVAAVGDLLVDGSWQEVRGNARVAGAMTLAPSSFRMDEGEAWLILGSQETASAMPVARASVAPLAGTIALGAAAGAGAGLLASFAVLGALRGGTFRLAAGAFFAPLYSRIARAAVLDHRHRTAIHDAVRAEPGITPREIADELGVAWTTVAYHLRRLESSGLVHLRRDGRRMRFYAADALGGSAAHAVMRDPTASRVATHIAHHPDITQKDVALDLALSPSLVSWHAARLEEAGLIVRGKVAGRVRYRAGPAWPSYEASEAAATVRLVRE